MLGKRRGGAIGITAPLLFSSEFKNKKKAERNAAGLKEKFGAKKVQA